MLKHTLSVAAVLALMTGTIDARGMGHGNGYKKSNNLNNTSRQSSKQNTQNQRTGRHNNQRINRSSSCDISDINSSEISIDTTSCYASCNTTDMNATTVIDLNTSDINNTTIVEINTTTIPTTPVVSNLSEELANTIAYMGNEERLAYDVYNTLYAEWGINQFTNIASKSEVQHIEAVQALVQKYKMSDDVNFTNIDLPALGYMNTTVEDMDAGTYEISEIQALYDDLVAEGSTSEIDALKVGCKVEVIDVNDLNKYIILAEESHASDVIETFNFLRDGSYNHYWAFDKGLKNKGIEEGCCAIGIVDGVDYCHTEYPNK